MKVNIYSSNKPTLFEALQDIKNQIQKDFKKINFLLIALNPKYESIEEKINKLFPNIKYAAFHAIDAFKNDEIATNITISVFEFEKNADISLYPIDNLNLGNIKKIINYLNKNKSCFHIIVTGFNEKINEYLNFISDRLYYSSINNIIGGISSGIEIDNELRTWQFTNNKIIKNGLIIISFRNIKAQIGISLGFKPYGITYKITKAKNSKLYEVDYGIKFSTIAKKLLKGIKNIDEKYLWYIPLNILDEKDGYVATLRAIKEVKKYYVELFGDIKNEQKFKLSFATEDDLLEEDKKIALKVKEKIEKADALFNFSCIARQYILDKKQKEEIEIYYKTFKAPLFGFFTFGEIGPDKMHKKLKLYNETSLLLAIKEL
ncbi:MAG TPA: hypothetical protein EYH54_03855 [Nautiliaceae bacterium]|nr:hypothetical protein [Nautiliaceae bacterium]